jgi:hypothetical protein
MTTVLPETSSWFRYFPEDYRWSAAVCNILGTANCGGSDIGEVDRAGRRLQRRLGDDEAWFEEWRRLGDEVRRLAETAEGAGHRLSAASAYLRACCYYQWGSGSGRRRTPLRSRFLPPRWSASASSRG